ncbi:MAG: hypothetical protein ACRDJU_13145 [Actinomycetota bacterium]
MIRARRARRGWAAALAAMALIGAGCSGGHAAQAAHSPVSARGPGTASPPGRYLAADGTPPRLVVIDRVTGKVVKKLTPAEPGGGANSPTMPSSGSVLYFGQGDGTCGNNILKVPVAGGTPVPGASLGLVDGAAMDEAGEAFSVRPDGRVLAVGRDNSCLPQEPSFTELALIDTVSGAQVVTDTSVDGPASDQAWSPDGTELLTIRDNGIDVRGASGGIEFHLLTLGSGEQVTGDRTLSPAQAGCSYDSALFSPSSGDVIADLDCGLTGPSSLVELDPKTGAETDTVLSPQPGVAVGAQAIDPSGVYLMYETGPWPPSPTSTAVSWLVLDRSSGRSTPLAVPPGVVPGAWYP